MQEYVVRYIRGCIICCTIKASNRKQGLCHPLPIPTPDWEIIYMDFVGGLPTTRKGHDYIFVVVDRFINMCILMPCKNTIKRQEVANMFFEQAWIHFGIPRGIISDKDTRFIGTFWITLCENMDTKLKRYTTFHPHKEW
jgi:hypothetical protein